MNTNKGIPVDTAVSNSIEDTIRLARKWVERFLKDHSVGLKGELGVGKTVFVRGMVAALGGDINEVRSPTFTLMNIYGTNPVFYHFDLFRLDNPYDLDGIGFFDFIESSGTKAVEWPDKIEEAMDAMDFIIEIRDNGKDPDSRVLNLLK